jgi:hypothetical protein
MDTGTMRGGPSSKSRLRLRLTFLGEQLGHPALDAGGGRQLKRTRKSWNTFCTAEGTTVEDLEAIITAAEDLYAKRRD